jgi:hypothetical protein
MTGRRLVGAVASVVLLAGLLLGAGGRPATAAPADGTLPPGAALPDDATCAARVMDSGAEIRPGNTPFNQTRGRIKPLPGPFLSRLSGNYTGTTDDIIQWAACKWGIDADVVRAQAGQESSWFMSAIGDFTSDPNWCAPGHAPGGDGRPGCPESVGLMGVKFRYHGVAFPEAGQSTAYNLDYTLSVWRSCFEGQEQWLADHPPRSGYRAGDMWGCLGRWYAGDWRSGEALGYIGRVQQAYQSRSWESAWFRDLTAPASAG